jgi:glutathione peroxidase
MVVKTSVAGPNANPLYKELLAITKQAPMWNFHKYLILPEAKQVYSYSSDVQPDAPEVMDKLKPFLK